MKTEHKLALELKNMMATTPLDEISVITLAKKCGVNRQTFYYHYHDVYDLLAQVFLDEKVPGIEKVKSLEELITTIYSYYDLNAKFIDASLNSAGAGLTKEFFYNVVFGKIVDHIQRNELSGKLTLTEIKNIARFYASGFTFSFVYYLSTHKNKSLLGLKKYMSFLTRHCVENSVAIYVKNKEK